jgi:predicted DCC family thiol-disulfide oxidoreductase YuxK
MPSPLYETLRAKHLQRQRQRTGDTDAKPRQASSIAQSPLILFDGVCNLCNAWVRFVVRHDPAGVFRFAAQQSPIGQTIVSERMSGPWPLSSVILIVGDLIYTDSSAVLEISARLTSPWSWLRLLRVIPRRSRDSCYRFIVGHRYQWFGKTDACQAPPAELRSRFVG